MASFGSLLWFVLTSASSAIRLPQPRQLGREIIAGAITPPVLGGVVAAGLAGKGEPEGSVLRLVPRRLQEAMRESRIAWIMYSQFEYIAAGIAVVALAPKRTRQLLKVQLSGPDFKDVPCGALGARCDVYLPDDAARSSFDGMLLFVPGGAWSHGYKSFYTLTSRRLANELGCPVAAVGYDLYPKANGPVQVAQVDEAVRWAESGAPLSSDGMRRLINNKGRVAIVGHSAGGQLCAAALLERDQTATTASSSMQSLAAIASLTLLSAPLELRRHVYHEAQRGVATVSALSAAFAGDDGVTYAVGDEAALKDEKLEELTTSPNRAEGSVSRYLDDSQPMARLSPERVVKADWAAAAKRLPPVVALFHGTDDPVVPLSSSMRFEAALKEGSRDSSAVGAPPKVIAEYRNECSHLDYILELITIDERSPPLVDFLKRVLSQHSDSRDVDHD